MGQGQPVLRSGDPEGVMQEMWTLFAVYQAICVLTGIAVSAAGIPPDRISFPHALQAATSTVAAFPPDQADLALAKVLAEDPHARLLRPRPPGPGQPPEDQEGRRLPGPPARRARRDQRHPPVEFHPLYPWQVT
jgi:hypothetical protein